MRKRILSALLVFVLCVGIAPLSWADYKGYSDVPEDHWAAESVRRATELGIFQGVSENVFGRGQAISRAAFVTALVRMFGWESVSIEEATFTDVAADKWYFSAVETAVANGAVVVTGTKFRPMEQLKRGEMAAMLMRALGYASLAGTVNGYDCPFSDVTINKGFITMAYDMGIVDGVGDGKFAPDATATREQAAAILVRVYDKVMGESVRVESEEGYTALRIKTPAAESYAEIPTTPLEPIGDLYTALRELKESGQDMSRVVFCLKEGGVQTTQTNQGWIISSGGINGDDVDRVLEIYGVRLYYSERYESAYCVYSPNIYQKATVWYQSERSFAAKLQLARLFGITKYILE